MGDMKYKEWILESIDQLRRRKARPDRDRICHMVERRHGLSYKQTDSLIERLVDAGIVVKVYYKGNTSYRNASKWKKSQLGGNVMNSNDTSLRIFNAVRSVIRNLPDGEKGQGACVQDIEKYLETQWTSPTWSNCPALVKNHLVVVLTREVEAGRLARLPNNNFVTVDGRKVGKLKSAIPNKVRLPTPAQRQAQALKYKSVSLGKKGRNIRSKIGQKLKRKVLMKKNSPVKVEEETYAEPARPGPVKIEDKCDYCLLTEECNRHGDAEELLVCKDCNAKAHPTCMDYSAELALRARSSPWQCMDCKTCYICTDSGDAEDMLFCDACDKGYHMMCHKPRITTKPTGKWVCNQCVLEGCTVGDEAMDTTGHVGDPVNADGILTPVDSPEEFENETKTETMDTTVFKKEPVETEVMRQSPVVPPSAPYANIDASEWTIDHIVDFLKLKGFIEQSENFKEQEIDGRSLMLLKRGDVLTGLSLKLGPALKIYQLVQRLQTESGMSFD